MSVASCSGVSAAHASMSRTVAQALCRKASSSGWRVICKPPVRLRSGCGDVPSILPFDTDKRRATRAVTSRSHNDAMTDREAAWDAVHESCRPAGRSAPDVRSGDCRVVRHGPLVGARTWQAAGDGRRHRAGREDCPLFGALNIVSGGVPQPDESRRQGLERRYRLAYFGAPTSTRATRSSVTASKGKPETTLDVHRRVSVWSERPDQTRP